MQDAYRGEPSRAGWTTEADLLDGQRVDGAMVAGAQADPGVEVLLAEESGRLLACCQLTRPDESGIASFGMFAVDPPLQDRGLGRELLAEAERIALVDWGAERLQMTVIELRTELIQWYERRGYRRTGEVRPFPSGDERFGLPRRDDLRFAVLDKQLGRHDPSNGG